RFAFVSPAIEVKIHRDARGAWLELTTRAPIVPAHMEYALAAFYLRTRAATRSTFGATAVELASPPARADACARVFGCAPRFERSRWALHVSRDAWHAINPRADANLMAILVDYAARVAAEPASGGSVADDVRAAIRDQLATGAPTLAATARRLA